MQPQLQKQVPLVIQLQQPATATGGDATAAATTSSAGEGTTAAVTTSAG